MILQPDCMMMILQEDTNDENGEEDERGDSRRMLLLLLPLAGTHTQTTKKSNFLVKKCFVFTCNLNEHHTFFRQIKKGNHQRSTFLSRFFLNSQKMLMIIMFVYSILWRGYSIYYTAL